MKNKNHSQRLIDIGNKVEDMSFSIENLTEIILLFKETIRIQKSINRHRSKNPCLNNLLNTYDKEYQDLISKAKRSQSEIEASFKDFQTSFFCDLSMFCIDQIKLANQ